MWAFIMVTVVGVLGLIFIYMDKGHQKEDANK
jgi:hypothetical protein